MVWCTKKVVSTIATCKRATLDKKFLVSLGGVMAILTPCSQDAPGFILNK